MCLIDSISNKKFAVYYSRRVTSNEEVQERLNRLRENFGNSIDNSENDNELSKEIQARMNSLRSKAPSVHDLETNVDDLYTTRRVNDQPQSHNTIEINGRTVATSIPRDQIEIVRSSDY
ncbi:hypothetical protein PPL_10594 [Heterostelium album PN500]|uniref:Uncharacterized protein n=1 Tax=Heterostelium pallidum (strain ATCC 26659 / Pp 5 / PN500) TaxID=670386 RepID=D3BRI3_HETP5|nr:hypothetical protein PPL_10594 [Heterostelium album PN500]EFA76015.1 hypothetical protein PPL_10594 [Heterostelium album PN500]|eukprot:XP_020428149.1 hypothetical protein PPL_10594 [Heterostelium album PN500]